VANSDNEKSHKNIKFALKSLGSRMSRKKNHSSRLTYEKEDYNNDYMIKLPCSQKLNEVKISGHSPKFTQAISKVLSMLYICIE